MHLNDFDKIGLFVFLSVMFFNTYYYVIDRNRRRKLNTMLTGQGPDADKQKRFLDWFKGLIKPLMPNTESLKQMQLVMDRAGFTKMSPEELFTVRCAAGAIGGVLFGLLFLPNVSQMLLFGGTGGAFCYLLPKYFITNKSGQVQRSAQKECLDYTDLLTIAVESGADINRAVGLISEYYPGVLSEHFSSVYAKVKGGQPIDEALTELSRWLDVKDITLLIDSILQSKSTGTPLAKVLEAQGKRIRDAAKAKATEQAQKIPVKMVFPIMFCIMPAIFIVTIGPTILGFSKAFKW